MRTRFGDCVLDTETRQLFVGSEEVHLQPKAFQFLELLLENRPKALSKDAIHEKLWPGTFVSDGTLTSLLAEVRDAVGDSAREPRFVRTVHRFGYAFCGAAQEVREQSSPVAGQKASCWLIRGRRRYALAPGDTIIGRDPGAAVFLDDASVSRRHARILVSDGGVTLEDLGSKNGTHVQEKRVEAPVPHADGANVRIGSVALTLRIFPMPDSTLTSSNRSDT
jgi:DNA-binding winged helix-turn-helix (wHTH) protein